jgi:hypothetical protein
MNINDIESMAEPKIIDYVLTKSRIIGEEYIPVSKAKVYSFDELARKYGFRELLTSDLTGYNVLQLFKQYLPFTVLISEAPYCYAVELNKDNFVHILARSDYLPKQYLSGVSNNLPFSRFMLDIAGEQHFQRNDRTDIINLLAETWKLW